MLYGRALWALHELRVVLGRRKLGRRAGFASTLDHAFDSLAAAAVKSADARRSTTARDEFVRSLQTTQAACDRWIANSRTYRHSDLHDELARLSVKP